MAIGWSTFPFPFAPASFNQNGVVALLRGEDRLARTVPHEFFICQAVERRRIMSAEAIIRIIALCIVLAGAEMLHGIARIRLMIPRIGKDRAVKLSALTGTLLAFAICWMLVPGIGLASSGAHLTLGVGLAAFMASFDMAVGRWLMRKSWAKIWPDFDPRSGNYLLFGLLGLSVSPLLVWYAVRP